MRARCRYPKNNQFKDYGGRGISVCKRWDESFKAFLEDMGPKPKPTHQIDRIDNDGNYEPENCRWATRKQNNRNKRNNRMLVVDGQKMGVPEASEKYGIQQKTILMRLYRGWSETDAATVLSK